MNLPNQLTILRLILAGVFVLILSADIPGLTSYEWSIAFIIFAVAAFTDFLDGYLARKHQQITNFGKLMDPLADKVLVAAGFIILVEVSAVAAWVVIVILTREFLVTGIRLVASAQGKVVAADKLGKQKTIWQLVTLLYLLMAQAVWEPMFNWMNWLYDWEQFGVSGLHGSQYVGPVLIYISLILTVWSGIGYAVRNWHLIRE
ncbi:MAG: CDP-diacylglycerol--glycerol-3-phosphate 3-phosphatidyltransferase [Verrucomicrobiota bacterium]